MPNRVLCETDFIREQRVDNTIVCLGCYKIGFTHAWEARTGCFLYYINCKMLNVEGQVDIAFNKAAAGFIYDHQHLPVGGLLTIYTNVSLSKKLGICTGFLASDFP